VLFFSSLRSSLLIYVVGSFSFTVLLGVCWLVLVCSLLLCSAGVLLWVIVYGVASYLWFFVFCAIVVGHVSLGAILVLMCSWVDISSAQLVAVLLPFDVWLVLSFLIVYKVTVLFIMDMLLLFLLLYGSLLFYLSVAVGIGYSILAILIGWVGVPSCCITSYYVI